MNKKERISFLKDCWESRNPTHDFNLNTQEDMFWETVLCVFDDMNKYQEKNTDNIDIVIDTDSIKVKDGWSGRFRIYENIKQVKITNDKQLLIEYKPDLNKIL